MCSVYTRSSEIINPNRIPDPARVVRIFAKSGVYIEKIIALYPDNRDVKQIYQGVKKLTLTGFQTLSGLSLNRASPTYLI